MPPAAWGAGQAGLAGGGLSTQVTVNSHTCHMWNSLSMAHVPWPWPIPLATCVCYDICPIESVSVPLFHVSCPNHLCQLGLMSHHMLYVSVTMANVIYASLVPSHLCKPLLMLHVICIRHDPYKNVIVVSHDTRPISSM